MLNPCTDHWRLPDADGTAGWGEITTYLLGVCEGVGKRVAGQEGRASAIRARREVVVERLTGADTAGPTSGGREGLRKGPTSEWRWTAVLLLSYPGLQKKGVTADSLDDAEAVGKALTNANPQRGWRLHVGQADVQQAGDHLQVRLTLTITAVWHHGTPDGLEADSAEATAAGGVGW